MIGASGEDFHLFLFSSVFFFLFFCLMCMDMDVMTGLWGRYSRCFICLQSVRIHNLMNYLVLH